jgi:hypothetical protein
LFTGIQLVVRIFPINYFKRKKKKKDKKNKKESLLYQAGRRFCQGFFKKYYPTKEVWRFFKKPEGLDLDKTLSIAAIFSHCLSWLYFLF